jgi:plasmid stabilization system protein ParE
MTAYALHPEAFTDLDGIRALVAFPHQGYRRPNLTSRPLRFKLAREYVIAYAPEKKPLWIVAVFPGRRSPRVIEAILRGRDQGARRELQPSHDLSQQRCPIRDPVHQNTFIHRVRPFADCSQSIQRRNPQRCREIAVRSSAGCRFFQRHA